ncbi:MAG TPA: DinB family protein [Frankiaceae bacterium]|nr:DinB family protein [Frankiaceae bacterium]
MDRPVLAFDERAMLAHFLDGYRDAVLRKVEGLTDEQAKWSPVPSGTSLFGIVSHLVATQRWWFAHTIGGLDVDFPWTEEDPDADWRGAEGATLADVVRAFQEESERSRAILATADLDRVCAGERRDVSVRWVAVHMVEELARHAGHADVVRELLDGTTGW